MRKVYIWDLGRLESPPTAHQEDVSFLHGIQGKHKTRHIVGFQHVFLQSRLVLLLRK
jgi:hypothetical protein